MPPLSGAEASIGDDAFAGHSFRVGREELVVKRSGWVGARVYGLALEIGDDFSDLFN